MILTRELLFKALNCGAINRKQAEALGLKWPVQKGWMRQILGREISVAVYETVARLRVKKKFGYEEQELFSDPPLTFRNSPADDFANQMFQEHRQDFQ